LWGAADLGELSEAAARCWGLSCQASYSIITYHHGSPAGCFSNLERPRTIRFGPLANDRFAGEVGPWHSDLHIACLDDVRELPEVHAQMTMWFVYIVLALPMSNQALVTVT